MPKVIKTKDETVITGTCRFCGQVKVFDYVPEDPDEEATLSCQCIAGDDYRERGRVLEAARKNIEDIFGDHFQEVAETFLALREKVYDGKIGRVTIKLPGGATARLWMTSATAMKVDYKKTTVTELSTGI